MRYINRRFTYLLTYCVEAMTHEIVLLLATDQFPLGACWARLQMFMDIDWVDESQAVTRAVRLTR